MHTKSPEKDQKGGVVRSDMMEIQRVRRKREEKG